MKYRLQEIRKEAKFRSAADFAAVLGMSARTYTNYEQGVNKLTIELAWRFADALGAALGRHVSLDELAGRDFREPSATDGLTSDERTLVDSYRASDDRGRGNILDTARREKSASEADVVPVGEQVSAG